MAIAHRYIESAELIVTVWDGHIAADEWAAVARRQVAEPEWALGRLRLTDARTADTSDLTQSDIDGVSAIYRAADADLAGVTLAIVATDGWSTAEEAEQGLKEFGVATIVFNTVDTACLWLGADADLVKATIRDLREQVRRSDESR
jgi:hypothetical protein